MCKSLKFLVLCAMGMSSSMLVKKIKEAATEKGYDLDIHCYFCSNFKELDYNGVDAVLMAPQVRNQIDVVKDYVKEFGVTVIQVDMMDYGMMKGAKVFTDVLKQIDKETE